MPRVKEAACRWEPHRLAAVVVAADAAVVVADAVEPQAQHLAWRRGWIRMLFLLFPAARSLPWPEHLLPLGHLQQPEHLLLEQPVVVVVEAVAVEAPLLRDHNLQQLACSF